MTQPKNTNDPLAVFEGEIEDDLSYEYDEYECYAEPDSLPVIVAQENPSKELHSACELMILALQSFNKRSSEEFSQAYEQMRGVK